MKTFSQQSSKHEEGDFSLLNLKFEVHMPNKSTDTQNTACI
jgi:hypothetical protein